MRPELFNQLVRSRRSVYPNQFVKGRQIPDEIILQLLENANWAPTHKRTEPWRFVVFTGGGLNKFAAFQSQAYKESAGISFKQDRFEKLLNNPLCASHVVSIGLKRSLEVAIPEIEEIEAVACAVENIYLSATAYGIGGYWTTGGVTYDENARTFFGLSEQDKLLGFFYLGYIAIPSAPSKRGPVEEKISWYR